jgi:hypothetical protein
MMAISRARGEGQPDHQADQAGHVPELIQPLDPVAPETHVVHEGEAPEALGHPLHGPGVAVSLLHPDFDRGRQRVHLQVAVGVAEFDQLAARPGERLLLGDVGDRADLGKGGDVLGRERDRLGGGPAEHERDDLHPLLDAAERLAQVDRHQAEEAEGEEREGDGGDGQRRQERGPAEGEQGLAGEEPHDGISDCADSGSSAWLSYTTEPSRSSMIR